MYSWRPICADDRAVYTAMATAFYQTDAVIRPVPQAHIDATFAQLMNSDTYASAYICEVDGETAGYALLAKTFSQEAGGLVIWVEELYIKEGFRGKGLCTAFLKDLLCTLPPDIKRVRLEVERENEGAVRLYESLGFSFLEYDQMMQER